MIDSRCATCRFWRAPRASARQKSGHCDLDGELTHPGYRCDAFNHTADGLLRIMGTTPAELAWLQAHRDASETRALRLRFLAAYADQANTSLRQSFTEALQAWRETGLKSGPAGV